MTEKLAVLGENVDYSLSPLIHNHWIEKHGIEARYGTIAARAGELARVMDDIRRGYRGCNVTIPHKGAVMAYLDRIDPQLRDLGAVNTVVVDADGSLRGENTDIEGFLDPLEKFSPPGGWDRACVAGAGGAARAVIAGLRRAGTEDIRVVARSPDRMGGDGFRLYPWDRAAQALEGARLLVNATPRGMRGKPELEWDLGPMAPGAVIYDLVYAPAMTGLLRRAAAAGLVRIGGLEMLIAQAARSFEIWFGFRPKDDGDLRRRLMSSSGPSAADGFPDGF